MKISNEPLYEGQSPFPCPLIEIKADFPEQEWLDAGHEPAIHVELEMLLELIDQGIIAKDADEGYHLLGSYEVNIYDLLKEACINRDMVECIADWLEGWADDLRELYK